MNSLLPPGFISLERRLAQTCSGISDLQVPLRDLWEPGYLSGQFPALSRMGVLCGSLGRGLDGKRQTPVVKDAFYISSA